MARVVDGFVGYGSSGRRRWVVPFYFLVRSGYMGMWNVFNKKIAILAMCLTFVAVCCSGSFVFAYEDAADLPQIDQWVNGMAVTADGVYLSDTWAVDKTGVSLREYVLLDQDCFEVMRVAKYPEDIENGDTTPATKYDVMVSAVLPKGATGDAYCTLISDYAVYFVSFLESEGHCAKLSLYPGVYRIADVELANDSDGAYHVENFSQIDTSVDDAVMLEFAAGKAEENDEAEDGAAGGSGNSDGSAGQEQKQDNVQNTRGSELLADTVKTAVAILALLGVYVYIKRKREKSEESSY